LPRGETSGSGRVDQLVRDFKLPDRAALGHALDRAASAYWAAVYWGTGSEDGAAEADALDELGKVLKPAAAALSEMADAQRQGGERMDEHTYYVLILALEDADPAMTEQEAEAWLDGLTLGLARLDRVVADIPRQRYGRGQPRSADPVRRLVEPLAAYWQSLQRPFTQDWTKERGGTAFIRRAIELAIERDELPRPKESAVKTAVRGIIRGLPGSRQGRKKVRE
jgi:hypothetical protein